MRFDVEERPEYLEVVRDILNDPEFVKLNQYRQHSDTSRLVHSINVSYLSWRTAEMLGWDAKSAARIGLLHDLYFYGYGEKSPSGKMMAFDHPETAAKNSERFNTNEKERRAIRSHMFPLGPIPTSREAWLLTCADKLCACAELIHLSYGYKRS